MTDKSDNQENSKSEMVTAPGNHEGPASASLFQLLQDQKAQIHQLLAELKQAIKSEAFNTARQLEAFHQLQALIGDIPASLHGWPVSPDFALRLVRKIRDDDYDLIIEFGSGVSTYLELRALERRESRATPAAEIPQLIVFEHLEPYLQQSLEFLARSPLRKVVDLRLRPLEPWQDESGSYSFYSGTEIIGQAIRALFSRKRLHGKPTDSGLPLKLLVVIDGPPGSTCHWARYPALPIILAACEGLRVAIDVLMDDVKRFDEQEMAGAWEKKMQALHISYTRQDLDYEKGGLLLRISALPDDVASHLQATMEPPCLHDDREQLLRQRNVLERECERRYAALHLSEQQALTIRQLLREREKASLAEAELRAQLADQIHVVNALEKELLLVRQQLDERQVAPKATVPTQLELDGELKRLREKNLLLQLQMKQVQEELEHYVLLAKQQAIPTLRGSQDGAETLPEPQPKSKHKANHNQDQDTINANRARLQTIEPLP